MSGPFPSAYGSKIALSLQWYVDMFPSIRPKKRELYGLDISQINQMATKLETPFSLQETQLEFTAAPFFTSFAFKTKTG